MARKNLCRPCAAELEQRGKTVKSAGEGSRKITCAQCGRRRFGAAYEVTGRAARKKKESSI